jgi:alpha-amylase/alpha-mannosidase (GH57 family)
MPQIQVLFVWHQHQPFYKDLATGVYRLPWVRMHALKDYYGMVKLLDEFPDVHQTFNLVPSLITQVQDYANGTARDPFLDVATKPAPDLSLDERRFALTYLFQANETQLIRRYPRYAELFEQFRGFGLNADRAAQLFRTHDFTDLQVLSQLSWFDEFFLHQPDIAGLVRKGRNYTIDDQRLMAAKQREIIAAVLPAHAEAGKHANKNPHAGTIEISTSPFYHPILPLLCDNTIGAISTPDLPLPHNAFIHPEDARDQLQRALDLHEQVFGVRPCGVWPSEGSVSEQAIQIAAELGVQWMATDEGVLGRTLGWNFHRSDTGILPLDGAQRLYRVYRYESPHAQMHMVFRDHALSDLIGFVYSGMPAKDAANDFLRRIRANAQQVIKSGRDAVVPIILDGENAWEFYPESGREFLRRVYDGIQKAPDMAALTVSEAIEREHAAASKVISRVPATPHSPVVVDPVMGKLTTLVPGSWINANFNVWIGAPEDNRSWDYLYDAREFYAQQAPLASEKQRKLAYEELLICEGSDWNWWYGPEHHTANDRDFDELYRKHLSNVYQALGSAPPDYLAQPIASAVAQPVYTPQTAYIHPDLGKTFARYFDWIGAAMYTAERRSGAMHGAQFLLESIYAGVNEENLYVRADFIDGLEENHLDLVINIETTSSAGVRKPLRFEAAVEHHRVTDWRLREASNGNGGAENVRASSQTQANGVQVRTRRNFECKIPLTLLGASEGTQLNVRVSVWRDRLPLDAMPVEGFIELTLAPEWELEANIYNYGAES